MSARPLKLSLVLMAATIAFGLAIRFVPFGLPAVVVKYSRSTLWALMIYWIVSTLLPSLRLLAAAFLRVAITTAIELIKLCH